MWAVFYSIRFVVSESSSPTLMAWTGYKTLHRLPSESVPFFNRFHALWKQTSPFFSWNSRYFSHNFSTYHAWKFINQSFLCLVKLLQTGSMDGQLTALYHTSSLHLFSRLFPGDEFYAHDLMSVVLFNSAFFQWVLRNFWYHIIYCSSIFVLPSTIV